MDCEASPSTFFQSLLRDETKVVDMDSSTNIGTSDWDRDRGSQLPGDAWGFDGRDRCLEMHTPGQENGPMDGQGLRFGRKKTD